MAPIVRSFEPDANVIAFKPAQFLNAFSPIDVTEAGMVIDVKPEPQNAALMIVVTEAGIFTDVKLVQAENTPSLIVRSFELEANVIDVKPVQFMNALLPIDVTLIPPNIPGISKGPG